MSIYNPVIRAQENLARTLQSGFSGLAQRPLDEAKFGLFEKKTLSDIERQKAIDARAERGIELQEKRFGLEEDRATQQIKESDERMRLAAEKEKRDVITFAQNNQRHLLGLPALKANALKGERVIRDEKQMQEMFNQPLTFGAMAPMMWGDSREVVSNGLSSGQIDAFLNITGVTPFQQNGITMFKHPNGQVVKAGEIQRIMPHMKKVMGVFVDPKRGAEHKIREMEKMFEMNKGAFPPETIAQYQKLKENKDNPAWLADQYEKIISTDLETLKFYQERGVDTTPILNEVKNKQQKLLRYQGILIEKAKQSGKEAVEGIKQTGKIKAEEVKATGVKAKSEAAKSLKLAELEIKALPEILDPTPEEAAVRELEVNAILEKYGLSPEKAPKVDADPLGMSEIDEEIKGLLFQ